MDIPPVKKILIASDTSDAGHAGVRYGLRLAKALDAEPTVIFVLFDAVRELGIRTETGIRHIGGEKIDWENLFANMASDAQENDLRKIGAWASEIGVTIQSRIEHGEPGRTIVKASKDYDLVVMATSGAGEALEDMIGHVSGRVLMRARCPVLLVKAGKDPAQIGAVKVTTDGSEESLLGVRWAFTLGKALNQKPEVVHVVETQRGPATIPVALKTLMDRFGEQEYADAHRKHAEQAKSRVNLVADLIQMEYDWKQIEGEIIPEILGAVGNEDLLVIAMVGESHRAEFGHTARAVAKGVQAPALFVKPEK